MLSLRALARATSRTSFRVASPSVSLRPAFHQLSRPAILRPQLSALFSTSRIHRDEYSQQLAIKLTSEIDLEQEESQTPAGSDANVEAFRAESDWNFDGDAVGSQDVFLTRQYEDETITVHFNIADFNSGLLPEDDELDPAMADEEDMEMQSGGASTKGAINQGRTANGNFKVAPEDSIAPADRDELADEEDQPQSYPIDVNVLVERSGGKGALKFLLTANEQQFVIEHLTHIPASEFTDAKTILRQTPDALYTGPPFQQLDEELQSILERYLDARGVTMDLASVIPDYIDVKEQKEYLAWLGRVKDFVE